MIEPDHHTATAPCDSCATFAADGAQFCGACGGSLPSIDAPSAPALHAVAPGPNAEEAAPTQVLAPVDPAGPSEQVAEGDPAPKRWKKRAATGTAVVLVLALLGFATQTHLQTRDDLSDTRAELAATSKTLASTEETLDETSAELEDTSAVLEETQQELQTRTGERDALQSEVQGLETDLEGVRGSLANAEQRITLQSGEITNLRSCLNGVSNALIYLADGYFSAALGALEAVEVSCNAAMSSI